MPRKKVSRPTSTGSEGPSSPAPATVPPTVEPTATGTTTADTPTTLDIPESLTSSANWKPEKAYTQTSRFQAIQPPQLGRRVFSAEACKPIGHKPIPHGEDIVLDRGTPEEEIKRLLAEGKAVWVRGDSEMRRFIPDEKKISLEDGE